MTLSLLVAVADNGVISDSQGNEVWHLPADLKRYREITMGHTCIMGRKTYEKIGHPLEGRKSIVVTKVPKYNAPGCIVADSLGSAYDIAKNDGEVFIVGGGQIYAAAMPKVSKMYITHVHGEPKGDIFFSFNPKEWKQTFKQDFPATAENYPSYTFANYERI